MSDPAAGRTMIDMAGDYQPLTRSLWLAVGAVLTNLVSLFQPWFGEAGFEVGDAANGERRTAKRLFSRASASLSARLRTSVSCSAQGAFEGEVLTGHTDPAFCHRFGGAAGRAGGRASGAAASGGRPVAKTFKVITA
jgi:hypothetical protein